MWKKFSFKIKKLQPFFPKFHTFLTFFQVSTLLFFFLFFKKKIKIENKCGSVEEKWKNACKSMILKENKIPHFAFHIVKSVEYFCKCLICIEKIKMKVWKKCGRSGLGRGPPARGGGSAKRGYRKLVSTHFTDDANDAPFWCIACAPVCQCTTLVHCLSE